MKAADVSPVQFAHWSFERDRGVGLYERRTKFGDLPCDEADDYLDEAHFYLRKSPREWPLDILDRLDDGGDWK